MNIFGVDPGIGRTGWGIIKYNYNKTQCLEYDCINTKANTPLEDRLEILFNKISKVLKDKKPKEAAVEKLFFNTNSKTAMSVGHARGVVLLAIKSYKIPCYHYTPLQVKTAITGYGRAEKKQIEIMVKTLLNLDEIPKPDDISDALAVALTHAYTKKIK